MAIRDEIGRIFDESRDLTIGLEEEFQLLDAETLGLANRYDELKARADELYGRELVTSELIQSEAEINSVAGDTFAQVRADMAQKRSVLTQAARDLGLRLCATGVHPFSHWRDQKFIDTEHYRKVVSELRYVAWTNNTFGLHVHVGVRGADRAVAVHDSYRSYLPILQALSTSSPFFHGEATHLQSNRAQIFVEAFPRCGNPDAYGSWSTYAEYAEFLFDSNSITESTMIWWSLRLHHLFGTLEVRSMDGQPEFAASMSLAGLAVALVARLLDRYDRGEEMQVHEHRFIEENRWRARRWGLDGRLIHLDSRRELPAVELVRRLLEEVEEVAAGLGLDRELAGVERILREGTSAQRQLARLREGCSIFDIHREETELTMTSHLAEISSAGGTLPSSRR